MRLVIIIIIKSYNGREKAAREEQFLKRAIIVFFSIQHEVSRSIRGKVYEEYREIDRVGGRKRMRIDEWFKWPNV